MGVMGDGRVPLSRRLWVAPTSEEKGAWPLPECFAEQYGSVVPGERGGIRVQGFDECVPLEAE